jgi:hypothetical protein
VSHPSVPLAKTKGALIYVGADDASTVTIFPAKGVNSPPIGTITDGIDEPERLFVDKKQRLYVSNRSTVTVYKRGTTSPSLTITGGLNRPTGIVVANNGYVYVGNAGTYTVSVYPPGKTVPSKTITMPTYEQPQNLAFDSANDLYVLYLGGSAGSGIIEFAPGSKTGKDLGITVGWPSAIEVDRKGNLIALVNGQSIEVFPPGQNQPSRSWNLTSGSGFMLSLNKNEKKLYASEYVGTSQPYFIIQQLDYPNGSGLTDKITNGLDSMSWPLSVSPDNVL